jgi:hypothetical protein
LTVCSIGIDQYDESDVFSDLSPLYGLNALQSFTLHCARITPAIADQLVAFPQKPLFVNLCPIDWFAHRFMITDPLISDLVYLLRDAKHLQWIHLSETCLQIDESIGNQIAQMPLLASLKITPQNVAACSGLVHLRHLTHLELSLSSLIDFRITREMSDILAVCVTLQHLELCSMTFDLFTDFAAAMKKLVHLHTLRLIDVGGVVSLHPLAAALCPASLTNLYIGLYESAYMPFGDIQCWLPFSKLVRLDLYRCFSTPMLDQVTQKIRDAYPIAQNLPHLQHFSAC